MRHRPDSFGSSAFEVSNVRFSLILPCLSDAKTLRTTLEGIAGQGFDRARFQVIVVDDGSNPPLETTALEFQDLLDVAYLRNAVNLGRAATRNKGIEVAVGEILVFMDVDQLLAPDFLTRLDEAFGSESNQSIRANTTVWPELLPKSAFLRYYDSRFLGNRPAPGDMQAALQNLPPKYYATTCIATGRRAVERVGGFDEGFSRYGCEDEDLGIRLHEAGIPLQVALRVHSFSIDDTLTVTRACKRLIDYAGVSAPLMLRKHPEYRRYMALGVLEGASQKEALIRSCLLAIYRPSIARALLSFLEKRDARRTFRPPAILYKLALLGFYLQGIRTRATGQRALSSQPASEGTT